VEDDGGGRRNHRLEKENEFEQNDRAGVQAVNKKKKKHYRRVWKRPDSSERSQPGRGKKKKKLVVSRGGGRTRVWGYGWCVGWALLMT